MATKPKRSKAAEGALPSFPEAVQRAAARGGVPPARWALRLLAQLGVQVLLDHGLTVEDYLLAVVEHERELEREEEQKP